MSEYGRANARHWKQVYVTMPPGLKRKLREHGEQQVPRLTLAAVIVTACIRLVDYDPTRDEDDPDDSPGTAGPPPDP